MMNHNAVIVFYRAPTGQADKRATSSL